FERRDPVSEPAQSIAAAALVPGTVHLFDQAVVQHAADGAIQSARKQGQAAAAFHFLHDGVSVPLRLREGEKDFELDCGKWEEGGGISIPGECIHQEYSRVSQARRQAWHDAACPDRTATAHRRWLDVCCYFRCIVSKRGGTCEDPY